MLILTILLSIAFAAGFTLLPARVQHRKPACADGYAAKVLGRPFEIGAGLRDRKLI